MRRLTAIAAGCALLNTTPALAAPYTVDRLLALEQLGKVRVDPTKRWIIVQHYARWDSAPLWDLDRQTNLSLGRIQVFDADAGGAERALALHSGAGYTALAVSPGGKRLAVGRLIGHDYELGVVDLETGAARWLGVSPRIALWGPDVVWRSDDELLVSAIPTTWPDFQLGIGFQNQERLGQMWAAEARGEVAVTALGSGRWRDLRPRAPELGLVSINLLTGVKRVIISGEIEDFALAPGGGAVAAIVEGEDIQRLNEGPKTTASPLRFARLAIADLGTGKTVIPCFRCEIMNRLLSWSQDGRQLLAFAREGDIPFKAGRFWRFTAKGQARALDLGDLTPAFGPTYDTIGVPKGDWLGDEPVVFARRAATARADYWRITESGVVNLTGTLPAEPRALGVSTRAWAVASDGKVWRITATGANPWGVMAGQISSVTPPPPGFRGAQNYLPPLSALALSNDATPAMDWPGVRAPVLPPATRLGELTASGRVEISRDAHGVQTVIYAPNIGPKRTLVTVNASLAEVEPAKPIEIRHKGLNGQDLVSWLYLPPGTSTGEKPPVVVLPYPDSPVSPANALAPGVLYMSVNPLILAAQGYAALVPAMPTLTDREPIEEMAAQILAPVDAAAAQGLIDPDRVAAWGHSYGGYAVVAAATQTQRLRAVIATAPTVNLISAYAALGPFINTVPETGLNIMASTGWHETGQARMGVPPWVDPQRYMRNSPILRADKITTPMLIIYGDQDKYLDQPQNLFGALYRQNRDAIFLTYRGEAHVIRSPGNVRDQYARIFAFLGQTLAKTAPLKAP